MVILAIFEAFGASGGCRRGRRHWRNKKTTSLLVFVRLAVFYSQRGLVGGSVDFESWQAELSVRQLCRLLGLKELQCRVLPTIPVQVNVHEEIRYLLEGALIASSIQILNPSNLEKSEIWGARGPRKSAILGPGSPEIYNFGPGSPGNLRFWSSFPWE